MRLPLRYAARRLLRAPSFAIVSILMLGLGIALCTSAFSMLERTLLRALPFPEPEELVRVFTASREDSMMALAPGNAIELRGALGEIGDFALFMPNSTKLAVPGEPPQEQFGFSVSADFLRLLDIQPMLGRGFLPDEDQPGQAPGIILTQPFWRDQFASDPNILGKTVQLGTTNATIIGVMPPRFSVPLLFRQAKFLNAMTVWPDWSNQRRDKWLHVLGRLKPGITRRVAQARLDVFTEHLRHDYPTEMATYRLNLASLGTSFAPPQAKILYYLVFGLAASVLLIACANLGGVQLARAIGRRGEMAVRSAIGATRGDIVAVLATESLLLAGAGTGAGIGLAYAINRGLHAALGWESDLNGRVLLFSIFAGCVAAFCFGVVPAWFSSGTNLSLVAKDASRSSTGGRFQQRLKVGLIVGQLGIAIALVSSAFVFALGVRTFLHRDRGWQPSGLVGGVFRIPWEKIQAEKASPRLATQVEERLRSIPGITGVGFSSGATIFGYQDKRAISPEGSEPRRRGDEIHAYVTGINPAFFSTLRVPVREGRLFEEQYRGGSLKSVIVTASTARRLWPDESAVGKRVKIESEVEWREVVGVINNVSFAVGYNLPEADLQFFCPVQETPVPWYSFILRTDLAAAVLEPTLRKAMAEIEPESMLSMVGDLPTTLEMAERNRPLEIILSCFATSGLLIALIGVYGVMTEFALQRRREIGVRMALGADYWRILKLMLGHASRMLAVGVAIGAAGSLLVVRLLVHSMPALPTPGVLVQIAVLLTLGVVGLFACLLPAQRAARTNPSEVLRSD